MKNKSAGHVGDGAGERTDAISGLGGFEDEGLPRKRHTVVPAIFVSAVLLTLVLGVGFGVRALLGSGSDAVTPVATSTIPPIEEYTPVSPGTYRPPTRVDGPVYSTTGALIERPTGKVIKTVDGLFNIDISGYTERQISFRLVDHALHVLSPDSGPMREGGDRWWHEVVTTPPSEGGPSLNDPVRYAEILDRWHVGDYSQIETDLEWLRAPVGQ